MALAPITADYEITSESLSKTPRYGPEFPERLGLLTQERHFMDSCTR
ncbi:hypothetical protein [Nocardia sp. NPDC005366]